MNRTTAIVIGAMVVIAAGLVISTLRAPDVGTYAPTRAEPRDAGAALVGPVLHTVDATAADRWQHFSFRLGAVVDEAGGDWDLAFRRYQIIANGGAGFRGRGGLRDLGPVAFDTVKTVPADGYVENETRERNSAIASWYDYGFFSHVLRPKPHVWAVRTANGRYAKLTLVSYYCPGSQPGCVTLRYVFQGNGSTTMASSP